MAFEGKLVPVVLYPRFTTLAGEGVQFFTFPLDVEAYEGARLTFWRGPILSSTAPVLRFHIEESMDRDHWTALTGSSFDPAEDSEEEKNPRFSMKWFRAMAEFVGGTGTVTCWAQGFLVRRIG